MDSTTFTTHALLTAYCVSGAMMETFVVFPGWSIPSIQGKSLKELQHVNGTATGVVYLLPKIALTIQAAQFWMSPPNTSSFAAGPGFGFGFGISMLSISWLSSFLWQVPTQFRIRAGASKEDVAELRRGNYIRLVTMLLHGFNVALMIYKRP